MIAKVAAHLARRQKGGQRAWESRSALLTTPPANRRSVGNRSRLAGRPENTRFDVDAVDGSGREQAPLARGRLKAGEVGEAKRVVV